MFSSKPLPLSFHIKTEASFSLPSRTGVRVFKWTPYARMIPWNPGVIKYLHTNGFYIKFWKGWKVCYYGAEWSLRTPSLVGALVSPPTLAVPIPGPPLSPEHVWLSDVPVSGTCQPFCCNPFPASFSGGTFIFSFGPKSIVLSSKFLSPSTQNLRWLTSRPSASLQLHPNHVLDHANHNLWSPWGQGAGLPGVLLWPWRFPGRSDNWRRKGNQSWAGHNPCSQRMNQASYAFHPKQK